AVSAVSVSWAVSTPVLVFRLTTGSAESSSRGSRTSSAKLGRRGFADVRAGPVGRFFDRSLPRNRSRTTLSSIESKSDLLDVWPVQRQAFRTSVFLRFEEAVHATTRNTS